MRRNLVVLVVLLAPAIAAARTVYLNGVPLDPTVSIQPQTFVGCDVRFDEKGDIYITAKGYKVAVTPRPQPPANAPAQAVMRGPRAYWLITKQTERGRVQYDVDVFINDTLVKKIHSTDDPLVIDVSRFIRDGATNKVRMVAIKNVGERRVSMSPTDTMDVMIGEGAQQNGQVNITKVHVTFTRTAGETDNLQQEFELKAP